MVWVALLGERTNHVFRLSGTIWTLGITCPKQPWCPMGKMVISVYSLAAMLAV